VLIELIDAGDAENRDFKKSRHSQNRSFMKATSSFKQFVSTAIKGENLNSLRGGISQEDFDDVMAHLFVNNRAQYEIVKQMAQDGMIEIT